MQKLKILWKFVIALFFKDAVVEMLPERKRKTVHERFEVTEITLEIYNQLKENDKFDAISFINNIDMLQHILNTSSKEYIKKRVSQRLRKITKKGVTK